MYQRILVLLDGSPTSQRGLTEAIAMARITGGRLRLFHSVGAEAFAYGLETGAAYVRDLLPALNAASQKMLDEGAARARAAGVEATTVLIGNPEFPLHAVVEAEVRAWQAQLVVLGTHGRRGVSRLVLGSDAEEISRTCPVPVLLVHGAAGTAQKKCRNCAGCQKSDAAPASGGQAEAA